VSTIINPPCDLATMIRDQGNGTQESADARPLPRCSLHALQDQHIPSGPKARCSLARGSPVGKADPLGPAGGKGSIDMQWGEKGSA
jgi:hypothetical protein